MGREKGLGEWKTRGRVNICLWILSPVYKTVLFLWHLKKELVYIMYFLPCHVCKQDCEDGSDEEGCRDYSDEFQKMSGSQLAGREVEKWLYTLKTTCAARCAQAKTFTCMSFNHQ